MASAASAPQPPLSQDKLLSLVINACDKTLKGRANPIYEHDKIKEWSAQIITTLLASLRETHPQIKWLITTSLMQSSTVNAATSTGSSKNGTSSGGHSSPKARGVFIAQGAWWDNSRDGMKSFDLWGEKAYGGVDVTVCVAWVMPPP